MAGFLRGKQTGIQNDLSSSIQPQHFIPDDIARYGINSQISCLAYDPIQSLVAVGTNDSKFGPGKIYVFGHARVEKILEPARHTSFRSLHFTAIGLVSLDAKGELAIWDLDSGNAVGGQLLPGSVTHMVTDPMLDWAILGQSNGDILAYDLDRQRVTSAFRLPNLWRERDPRARIIGLVDMALHPRDIGKLLVAYASGIAIYSFKQAKTVQFLEYVVPPGAPGGTGEITQVPRRPRVTHALWHPTGTFVLTAHEDGSLVFWDPKDGRILMARTLTETDIDKPRRGPVTLSYVEPYSRISWCCKENPDDTGILVGGGELQDDPQRALTFIEFGQTPVYATSSWKLLSDHFVGKRLITLPLPPGTTVTEYLLIPRSSPYFAGAQDPIAIICLLSSGELITMSFPSGYPISPTNQLHPSMSLLHPFATRLAISTVDRVRWLGMMEKRNQGEPILKGGAEATRPKRMYAQRPVLQVAHADSTVRIWDVGLDDDIENSSQLQVDVAAALDRYEDVHISAMHMSGDVGEFAAGTTAGEVVIYRWGVNRTYGDEPPAPFEPNPGGLADISSRAERSLKEGLQPFALYDMAQGSISVIKVSDVGFVGVGSEEGFFSILDLRVPEVILQVSTAEFAKHEKRSSFIRGHSSSSSGKEWPVVIEFGVMTLEGDSYSSIACFVGTNLGKVATYKILPDGGRYRAELAGIASLGDKIMSICPIVMESGNPAAATGQTVAGLKNGTLVNGTLVVVTQTEIRVFKPANAKGASKSFDGLLCDAANVVDFITKGAAVVCIFGDLTARAYSLPALKEIAKAPLPMLDPACITSTLITEKGTIIGWTGPSELAVVHVWGSGRGLRPSGDTLINPELTIPPRPTISNLQWISGTQYVSPADMDMLLGGPNRPPSKRMLEAAAAEQRAARAGGPSSARAGSNARAGTSQEGWGEYLTRQLQERTEKLNLVNDSMDNLQEQSRGWADDVNKFVDRQKRNMVLGVVKGKFT